MKGYDRKNLGISVHKNKEVVVIKYQKANIEKVKMSEERLNKSDNKYEWKYGGRSDSEVA